MKKIIAVFVFCSSLGAQPASAQVVYTDYVLLVAGLFGMSSCSYGSKLYGKENKAAAAITLDMLSKLFGMLFFKEAAEKVLPHWRESVPSWLKPQTNYFDQLQQRKVEEAIKIASIPANATQQIMRIDSLKPQLLEHFIRDVSLKLVQSNGWYSSSEDVVTKNSKLMMKLAADALQLYPGFTSNNTTFLSEPMFPYNSTGETYVYSEEFLGKVSRDYQVPYKIDMETRERIRLLIDDLCENCAEKKNYYIRFFSVMGIELTGVKSDF